MLRTNLATKPFYNVRAVQVVLAGATAAVLALTLYNAVQIVRLTAAQAQLGAHADEAEREAARLRAEAAQIRTRINPKELETVTRSAREANTIIDRRAFSWTELFSRFEATLPEDVRITAVRPRLERDGTFRVLVTVEARRFEDLDAFIEALESTGAFRDVLSLEEATAEDGLIDASLQATYLAPERQPEEGRSRE